MMKNKRIQTFGLIIAGILFLNCSSTPLLFSFLQYPHTNQLEINNLSDPIKSAQIVDVGGQESELQKIPHSSSGLDATWTLMIYIAGDNNLESAALDDLNELEEIGSTSEVEITVQLDRTPGYDASNGDWTTTRRYHVEKDTSSTIIGSSANDLGEINMGDPNSLEDFIDWSQNHFPAENYALILWDHGSGIMAGPYSGGICWDDENNNDYLTEPEILTAIQNKNITLLGFDACLMASVEFWYALHSEVDVFVGSQGLEPGDGWPYDGIANWLVQNPTSSPQQLAQTITENYLQSYPSYFNLTQSALVSMNFENFMIDFNFFTDQLISNIGSLSSSINSTRSNLYGYGDRPYVDLYSFIEEIGIQNPALDDIVSNLKAWLDTNIIANDRSLTRENSHGLTIYFPENGEEYSGSYRDNIFCANSTWDEFLLTYYNSDIGDDQFEGNDVIEDAKNLFPGTYVALICNDSDYYSFDLPANIVINIKLSFSGLFESNNLELSLFHENFSLIESINNENELKVLNYSSIVDERIYIKVENSFGDGYLIGYSLQLEIPIDDDMYDLGEGNDVIINASDITANASAGDTLPHLVALDLDYYYFEVTGDALVTVFVEYLAVAGILTLEIYQMKETLTLLDTIGTADDNAFYQFGASDSLHPGYYILINNYENNSDYSLTVTIDTNADDIYDLPGNDNDNPYLLDQIGLSDGIYENLVALDIDLYNVTILENQWINITICFDNEMGDLDLYLFALDTDWGSSLSPLAESNYWVDDETIIYQANETKQYVIWVQPSSINLNYSLLLNRSQTFENDQFDGYNEYWDQQESFPILEIETNYTNLAAWDKDWYKIELTTIGSELIIGLYYPQSEGTLVLILYDATQEMLAYSFTSSPNEYLQYQFLEPGTYYIQILPFQRVENYSLYIAPVPEINLDYDFQYDGPLTINFIELVNDFEFFSSFYWDFGDGTSYYGIEGNQTHTYLSPGYFYVTLWVYTEYGYSRYLTDVVRVYNEPHSFPINLNGTSPILGSYFQIYWDYIPDADNFSIYSSTYAFSTVENLEPITVYESGNYIGAIIPVTIFDTYYVAVQYSNPFGDALSNVLAVEAGQVVDPTDDTGLKIPTFQNIIFISIWMLCVIYWRNRKKN